MRPPTTKYSVLLLYTEHDWNQRLEHFVEIREYLRPPFNRFQAISYIKHSYRRHLFFWFIFRDSIEFTPYLTERIFIRIILCDVRTMMPLTAAESQTKHDTRWSHVYILKLCPWFRVAPFCHIFPHLFRCNTNKRWTSNVPLEKQ